MRSAGKSPRGEMGSDAAWYCLQAKHKPEHIAAAHLREVKGVAGFCSRGRVKRQTRTRVNWGAEALFPRDLFLPFWLNRNDKEAGEHLRGRGNACVPRLLS